MRRLGRKKRFQGPASTGPNRSTAVGGTADLAQGNTPSVMCKELEATISVEQSRT